ncbi:hypothetical protein ACROYT_G038716 [Oculina patagonica]
MEKVFQGNKTKPEVKEKNRKEKQHELGVCRIRRSEGDTLGSGFVVKALQIIPGFPCPFCLISSDKVFPKDDFNIKSYYLDFRKLDSTKLKTIKLENIAASRKSTDILRTSGLVVIPINPSKKESIFTYRPFKVANEGIKPDDDLRCHYVNDLSTKLFDVKWLKVQQADVPGQYELHEGLETPYKTYAEVTHKGDRKPYGAVILKRSNNEFMVAGALTFTDDECKNISPVFFPLPLPPPQGPQAALNIKIDVETMKPTEHNTQDRTPVSRMDSGGSPDGRHQEASSVPVTSAHTQPSCTGAEAPQAPNHIPTEVLSKIALYYMKAVPPEHNDPKNFLAYMKEMRLAITGVSVGSLVITVKCDSLQILEGLWGDYSSGHLGKVVQRCFVTEEILMEFNLAELKLKTTILEEEYKACKVFFMKNPARDQCESVAVHGEKPTHFTKGKMISGTDHEGGSPTETDEEDSFPSDDKDQCESVAVHGEKPTHFTKGKMITGTDHEGGSPTETDEEDSFPSDDKGRWKSVAVHFQPTHFSPEKISRESYYSVKEQNRKEKQHELGVCRIRRSEGDTLGSGFVVKDLQIIPGFPRPYCLISSDKVFPKDELNKKSYYLDFRKLDSTKLKTIKLEDIAAGAESTDILRTSGLVVIPINPSKNCSKKESIFTYRPFKVAKEGIKPIDELRCHFVNDLWMKFFDVKWLKMQQADVPGQYELHEVPDHETPYKTYAEVTRKGDRKPYGAVILKRSNNEFMVAGALTFTDDECKNISPVFFPLPLPALGTSAGQPLPDVNNFPLPGQQLPADEAASFKVEASGETSNTAGTSAGQPLPDVNNFPPPGQQLPADEAASVKVEASGETSNTAAVIPIGYDPLWDQGVISRSAQLTQRATDKIALVIGNRDYVRFPLGEGALVHTCNDAKMLASSLLKPEMGFKVISLMNLTMDEMHQALSMFYSLLGEGVYGLVYFAGHGFEESGQNYMVPIDTVGDWVPEEAVCAQKVLDDMNRYQTELIVFLLDICRKRSSVKKSFAFKGYEFPYNAQAVIGFATCPQSEAYEVRQDPNGMYMKHLLKHITNDTKVEDVLHKVAGDVEAEVNTNRWVERQRPQYHTTTTRSYSLRDPIYHNKESDGRQRTWLDIHKLPQKRVVKCDSDIKIEIRFEHQNWLSNAIVLCLRVIDPGEATYCEVSLMLETLPQI